MATFRSRVPLAASTVILTFLSAPLYADTNELPPPTGPVVLEIDGNIARTNEDEKARFDLAMLEVLPSHSFTTHTPWEEGQQSFQGVRLSALLDAVGAGSDNFTAEATDDYVIEFAGVDPEEYEIIVAYKQNDEYLSVRTLGPLRIMYNFDKHEELQAQSFLTMAVWQLTRMTVH